MARIGLSFLARFLRRMESGYRAGLDLRTLWQRESEQRSRLHALVAHRISNRLERGDDLAAAMDETRGYFPPLVTAVVNAGDRSGRLDRSFGLLARHYESLAQTRNRLLVSIAWPLFQLVFGIFVIGALILIMDWLAQNPNFDGIDWLGWGWTGRQYFILYVAFVLGCAAALWALVVGTMKGWYGTLPLRVARRIPLLGGTIEAIALARFAWALSMAQEAGIDVIDSTKMSLDATQSYNFTNLEPQITESIRRGQDLYQALRATGEFPDEFLSFVSHGETTGELPEALVRVAGYLQDKIERNLKLLTMVGFVAIFLMVAAILVSLIFYLYFNLYMGQIQQFALLDWA